MRKERDHPFKTLSTQQSTYTSHTAGPSRCSAHSSVLSGGTGLPGSLGDGLGELGTHLAEDTILPCWGKPRWKDPNRFLRIKQPRSLLQWRQVMPWKEVGLESDRFKFESLLLNLLAI